MATALMIAHPGHELRVYNWLKKTKPIVCILTDGSGSSGQSRLASSTQIIKEQGIIAGDIYGRLVGDAIGKQIVLDSQTKKELLKAIKHSVEGKIKDLDPKLTLAKEFIAKLQHCEQEIEAELESEGNANPSTAPIQIVARDIKTLTPKLPSPSAQGTPRLNRP